MKLKFIDLLNTGVYSNTDIPPKPRGLHLGLLIYYIHKSISLWVARCCYYVEWRKAAERADYFKIKDKGEHYEQADSSRY